jgi:hypothetical protein
MASEIKRPRREADTSNWCRYQEYVELYFHSPYAFMTKHVVKHSDNFALN